MGPSIDSVSNTTNIAHHKKDDVDGEGDSVAYKGKKASLTTGIDKKLLMEDAVELSSGTFKNKLSDVKNKKNTDKSKKTDGKESDEDEVEDKKVDKTEEVSQINLSKEQKKDQDPFFKYRDLKDERDKLIQETAPQDRGGIKNKLDSLDLQMAQIYKKNKNLIDSSFAIDPAVQSTIADFESKNIDISEVDIHQNYRDINSGYKDAVLDYGTVKETYNKIIETYTEEYFEDGLRTLTSALSKDLARFNTQVKGNISDKYQLSLVMQDLYKLKNLHSFYLTCGDLLENFTSDKTSTGSFVGKFLTILEKDWVDTDDIENIANRVSQDPKDGKVLGFLNRMLTAVKSLPADNTYATPTEGANNELFDAINALRNQKAREEDKKPVGNSGK